LRIRPGFESIVPKKLSDAELQFRIVNPHCLALRSASKIEEAIEIDKEAVIQDLSSQRISEFFPSHVSRLTSHVWDCCAASGGKSILAYDILKNIKLLVTDLRESILVNLRKRFAAAGIQNYKAQVIDLSTTQLLNNSTVERFDLIICDAPCSGSGTWSRTPEQLAYFSTEKINYYSELQKRIALNVIPSLKETGKLLYITCSVFRKENEEVVDFILKNSNLRIEKMELLKGYDQKADTMFACLFTV